MQELVEWFSERHPGQVIVCKAGGFIDAALSLEFIGAAERTNVAILSIEAFLVESGGVAYPVNGRSQKLLNLDQLDCETLVSSTCGAARRVLTGAWAQPPTVDQTSSMHRDVEYTCMIRFTLDQ